MRDYSHLTDEEKKAEAEKVDQILDDAGITEEQPPADAERSVTFNVAPLLRDKK